MKLVIDGMVDNTHWEDGNRAMITEIYPDDNADDGIWISVHSWLERSTPPALQDHPAVMAELAQAGFTGSTVRVTIDVLETP